MSQPIVMVLAAPGAGGANVAVRLAAGTGVGVAAWDEVTDRPFGEGPVVRALFQRVLAARDRDWTCPPSALVVEADERAIADETWGLLQERGVGVIHDPAGAFLLGLLPASAGVEVVVVAADHEYEVRCLEAGTGMDPGDVDELVRATTARLAVLAEAIDLTVVTIDSDDDTGLAAAGRAAAALGRTFDRHAAGEVETGRPPPVEVLGREVDPMADRLLARAADVDAGAAGLVTGAALVEAASGRISAELDPFGGPRAAARRQLMWSLVGPDPGPRLELGSAHGGGRFVATEDVEVRAATNLDAVREALNAPPGSVGQLLLPDILAWCTVEELTVVLRLAFGVLVDGGLVLVGDSPAVERWRRQRRLEPLDVSAVVPVSAAEAGLEALGVGDDGAVAAHVFTARPSVVRELDALRAARSQLEADVAALSARVELVTAERDRVVVRHDRLRSRRGVRIVLRLAELVRPLFVAVRRWRTRGAGREG